MLSFDQFGDLLDTLAEKFPKEFYTELNGGICLYPQKKPNKKAGPGLYIMGEYCHDVMGRYINIYYGSFRAVYGGELSDAELKDELYATLSHEFTHHVESLAGERGLEIKDEEFLAQCRQEETD